MKRVKSFGEFINERETSEYTPPKYLVSPALDQEGNGTVDDDIDSYMTGELNKSKSYFKPGIRSANPPNKVDHTLDESVNEAREVDVRKASDYLKKHGTRNPNVGDWSNPGYEAYDYELKDGNKVALMDRGVTVWKFTKKENTISYYDFFKEYII
jgi:hypothetical protein